MFCFFSNFKMFKETTKLDYSFGLKKQRISRTNCVPDKSSKLSVNNIDTYY